MRLGIVYPRVYDETGEHLTIGGIQTYLLRLAQLCAELGFEVRIFQIARREFSVNHVGFRVVGIEMPQQLQGSSRAKKVLFAGARSWCGNDGILILGTHDPAYPCDHGRAVVIQHGVFWDSNTDPRRREPFSVLQRIRSSSLNRMRQRLIQWRNLQRIADDFERRPYCVCVDYNFLNWYRTLGKPLSGGVWVIPNTATLVDRNHALAGRTTGSAVRVLFARRFCAGRGTRLMASAAAKMLASDPSVRFTFAGEGPDEKWLRDVFKAQNRVRFIKYDPFEAVQVLLSHDISVVPSLESEGTSMSVLEAMGAGCAVVATCTGGITNVIIDAYNGRLVMPNEDSLYRGLAEVTTDAELRRRIACKGYETASEAFGPEIWKDRWANVLDTVAS